jgi:hypothetical protein
MLQGKPNHDKVTIVRQLKIRSFLAMVLLNTYSLRQFLGLCEIALSFRFNAPIRTCLAFRNRFSSNIIDISSAFLAIRIAGKTICF